MEDEKPRKLKQENANLSGKLRQYEAWNESLKSGITTLSGKNSELKDTVAAQVKTIERLKKALESISGAGYTAVASGGSGKSRIDKIIEQALTPESG